MRPFWLRRWLPALWMVLVVGMAHPADAQPPSPFVPGPWWKEFQTTLGMSNDQSHRVEAVFHGALPYLRHKRDELEVQEAELSRLITVDADEAVIAKQSDRVEAIRGVLNKSRTLMLVRMRRILTPDQRAKLKALREHWEREGGEKREGGDKDDPPPRRRN